MTDYYLKRYPELESCREDIESSVNSLISCYENGGKLLICGNGGSSADAEHISGELMKGFLKKRPLPPTEKASLEKTFPKAALFLDELQGGLAAIALPSMIGVNSAFCNDVNPALVYAQGVYSLAKPGDVLLCISTSGSSENVVNAAIVAKAMGVKVLALTGNSGGRLFGISDICIRVPKGETYQVQELHLPVYHAVCALVEEHFFSE